MREVNWAGGKTNPFHHGRQVPRKTAVSDDLGGREVSNGSRRVVFTIEPRKEPGRRRPRWWLFGNDGAVIGKVADLGNGARPTRRLGQYNDEDLQAAWERACDRGFRNLSR